MTQNSNKPATSFWVISILALIWNAIGVMAYLAQKLMTDEMKAAIPADQLEIMDNTPAWVTAAFAIAVWFGLLGCIVLLIRKKFSKILFMISLVGILMQMIYNLFIIKSTEITGSNSLVIPLMTIIIGLFLIWHAKKCTENGILS